MCARVKTVANPKEGEEGFLRVAIVRKVSVTLPQL